MQGSATTAGGTDGNYDEKNIRRRVYDALNVLMAVGVIRKEKKEIVWGGWPQVGPGGLTGKLLTFL